MVADSHSLPVPKRVLTGEDLRKKDLLVSATSRHKSWQTSGKLPF